VDSLAQDIRFGVRSLLRAPAFTAVALLTLALGIGGSTAIWSAVDAVLLRPLPYPEPERLVAVWTSEPKRGKPTGSNSYPDFEDYRAQTASFEDLAAFHSRGYTLTGGSEAERLLGGRVSAAFFPLLRVSAYLGRTFTPDDDRPGAPPVALLTHGLWQRRFGASPGVVGRSLTVDGEPHTVVGVLPASFAFPMDLEEAELFTPMAREDEESRRERGMHYLAILGRLGAGATLEGARAELGGVSARLAQSYPESNEARVAVALPLHEEIVGGAKAGLLILLGAVGLVMALACANVANLLLARASARERELAVRTATGASRGRLVRQLLTESLLLAGLGGVLGLALAFWGVDLFRALAPSDLPRLGEMRVDERVLAFGFLLSVLTGLAFGLLPAWRAARVDVVRGLCEGGSAGSAPAGQRLRSSLVVAEVALCLVLLVGAGLLLRSLAAVLTTDPGFAAQGVVTMRLTLPDSRYATSAERVVFYRSLLERAAAVPGVKAAGLASPLPMGGDQWVTSVEPEGRPKAAPSDRLLGAYKAVSPSYFAAMGIALRKGRAFTDGDDRSAPRVVVLSELMARQCFPGEEAVGRRVAFGTSIDDDPEDALWEVVGVAADAANVRLDRAPEPAFYVPHAQHPWSFAGLVVRAEGDPRSVAGSLRREVKAIDADVPAYRIKTLAELVADTTAQRRFNAVLVAAFALVGLTLAAVGIYGVVALQVSQRTREIGIRVALGADRSLVLRLVLGQALRLVVTGVAFGLLGAAATSRTVAGLLYRVPALDPATYLTVPVLLLLAGLLASALPARRALRIAPYAALRHE
jgi:putative ABC transport system permease protein